MKLKKFRSEKSEAEALVDEIEREITIGGIKFVRDGAGVVSQIDNRGPL